MEAGGYGGRSPLEPLQTKKMKYAIKDRGPFVRDRQSGIRVLNSNLLSQCLHKFARLPPFVVNTLFKYIQKAIILCLHPLPLSSFLPSSEHTIVCEMVI